MYGSESATKRGCQSEICIYISLTGANNVKYNKNKSGADKLCSLCTGAGNDKCDRGSKEPYYGYEGAFKCLQDGKGDVAFVKQSTVLSKNTSSYQLLCKDNTKKGNAN